MATVASNVTVATTGDFSYAPVGTALPTSPSAALNVAFLSVGYLSEDGVVLAQAESSTKIKAFQNADVVRVVQTEHEVTADFTMLETNANTLAIFFKGNYVSGVGQIKAGIAPHKAWVLHEIDGANLIRTVIPDGQVIDIGDLTLKNGEPVGYKISIECYPDASGVKAYMYFATATVSA
jgi:hypothetical protein